MKAILKFDLTDTDDEMALKRSMKSLDMALVLWEIVYNVRRECEDKIDTNDNITAYDVLDMVYNRISELLDEHTIYIDELTM